MKIFFGYGLSFLCVNGFFYGHLDIVIRFYGIPVSSGVLVLLAAVRFMVLRQKVACEMNFKVFICFLFIPTSSANPLIATNKLSLATWGSYYQQDHMGPGTYAFGYDIEDPVTGNVQFKQEERHPNGTVTGNYGYVDAEGRPHVVTYVSDENGYRAKVETEGEPTRYFPQAPIGPQGLNEATRSDINPLKIPLQGEVINPQVPIQRLNYPSYYSYVGVNAVSK